MVPVAPLHPPRFSGYGQYFPLEVQEEPGRGRRFLNWLHRLVPSTLTWTDPVVQTVREGNDPMVIFHSASTPLPQNWDNTGSQLYVLA